MRTCPECKKTYYDETLNFCLDDGRALLEEMSSTDEQATAILERGAVRTSPDRAQVDSTDPTAVFSRGVGTELRETSRNRSKLLAALGVLAVLLAAGFFAYRYFTPSKQIESIAVMPFVNASGNADVEYLSDGMTETLISSLSQLPNLSVRARSSVFRYKGKETDARTIAKELNVEAILTGKVVQRAADLSLYVELVDAATDKVIWSETYNRQLLNLVSLQTEIAKDVSQKLKVKLSGADERLLASRYTENPEAYQLYLRGRFFLNKRTPNDVEASIPFFQQAIAADPSFSLPLSGLADSYLTLGLLEGGLPPHEAMPKAREAARKALMIDDRSGEAHATLGLIHNSYDYDFVGAERELKRAIELEPNYATAHLRLSLMLAVLGRRDESLAAIRRALEIEPLSVFVNRAYGDRLAEARKYDEAVVQLKKTLELDNNYALVHTSLAWVYQVQGKHAESVEEVAKMYDVTGRKQYAALVRERYISGGWQGYLEAMTERPTDLRAYTKASHYAALGKKDLAFTELNRAYDNREASVSRLKIDPRLDSLRDDPRFLELIKKVGLPE